MESLLINKVPSGSTTFEILSLRRDLVNLGNYSKDTSCRSPVRATQFGEDISVVDGVHWAN